MLYVSSQICHGRLIIFQPSADTDVWHDVFFCICLGLLTVGSSQVQTQKWKQLQLATNHVWNRMLDFLGARCWERVQSFFCWAMFFLVRLTVTVGFGPVDGWFLTGPNSKMERVSASWQQITFGTECWIFFRGKRLGKSPVF